MDRIRIGFVGVGGMGQCAHLRNFVITPGCQVVALAELRNQLAQEVANRYGIERIYQDHRQMLQNEKLDAIVAIQQFQHHGKLVPELLESNLPVLTEKPLARSPEVGEKIVKAAQQSGAKLFIAYHKRSDPAVIFAREKIGEWKRSGALGRMKMVRITMPPGDWMAQGFAGLIKSDETYPTLEPDPLPSDMDAATAKKLEAFVNYYIHQVNLMRHLMGEDYELTFADPTGVLMTARSASGVAGILEMQPYRTTVDWQEVALVCFEKGWIRIELPAPLAIDRAGRVTVFEDPGEQQTPLTYAPTMPYVHAMRRQAETFVRAVKGEPTHLCQAPEALEDLKIARDYIRRFTVAQAP